VFTAGDNAFPDGLLADYQNCYQPTWGRHKARTYATLGNHEYNSGNANGAFDYFGDRVGPRGLGYYSYELGDWHVIHLNDNTASCRSARLGAGSVARGRPGGEHQAMRDRDLAYAAVPLVR